VGETTFKKCKACHSIIAPDGTEIQKGGKTGPNLYGVSAGRWPRTPTSSMATRLAALGATGAVWDEASLAAYVADPTGLSEDRAGDDAAKSKMSFKLADRAARTWRPIWPRSRSKLPSQPARRMGAPPLRGAPFAFGRKSAFAAKSCIATLTSHR
jgi:cytochrome c